MSDRIGVDAEGIQVAEDDGFAYRLTPCCSASVTGSAGICCRACYEQVDWRYADDPQEPIEWTEADDA